MHGTIREPQDIGHAVREVRRGHGLSQLALAESLGVTQGYLSQLERGLPKVLDARYLSILARLGITLSYRTIDE